MVDGLTHGANTPKSSYSNVVLKSSLNKKPGLKICCFNPESLFSKLDEIKVLLNDVCMDIICVTESWLKPHISNQSIGIKGFNIFRNDRLSRKGGGICIYIKSSVYAKVIYSESKKNIEISLIEVLVGKNRILLAVCYKPPQENFYDDLEGILNKFALIYSDIILCGDFNQDILKTSKTVKFLGLLERFSLKIKNTEPTYFYNNGASLLDLIITNTEKITFTNQISAGWKHDFLFFNYNIESDTVLSSVTYRDFKNLDGVKLVHYCGMLPWSKVYNIPTVDAKMNFLNELILNSFDECVPLRTVSINTQIKPPWLDDEIVEAIETRNFAHHLWKTKKTIQSRSCFTKLRNKVNTLIKRKKSQYLEQILNPKMPPDKFWGNVKKLGIKDYSPLIDPSFSASDFVEQFSSATTNNSLFEANSDSNFILGSGDGSFAFRNINLHEFHQALISIKSNSMGLDGISLNFIKLIFPYIGKYLLYVFNLILTTSIFPKCWKIARIIPVPKLISPLTTADFRPISILPSLSKTFEKIIQKQMTEFLNSNNLLDKYQSAYRPNHGTCYALLNIVDDIRRKVDRQEVSVLVLLDFSKAFDSIDHVLLIKKLQEKINFTSSACRLVHSYLSDRSFLIQYNGIDSEKMQVRRGIPQGSVLGPLLFSLYINDLPQIIENCQYHMFADDVQVYLSCRPTDVVECINKINSDIEGIFKWSQENLLTLNAAKSQSIVIYKNNIDTQNFPKIRVGNTDLLFSDKVKNLGLIINKELNWTDQVNSICKRVNFMLRRLWTITRLGSVELKHKLFLSFLFPHFLYSDLVLYGMYEYNFNKLRLLFNACVRYVFGLRKYDHISMYANGILGCSLSEYYSFKVCFSIFKLLYLKEPEYLFSKLSRLRSVRSNNLLIPRNATNIFNKSFFVRGVGLWNSLPTEIKSSYSPAAFQRNYFKIKNYTK